MKKPIAIFFLLTVPITTASAQPQQRRNALIPPQNHSSRIKELAAVTTFSEMADILQVKKINQPCKKTSASRFEGHNQMEEELSSDPTLFVQRAIRFTQTSTLIKSEVPAEKNDSLLKSIKKTAGFGLLAGAGGVASGYFLKSTVSRDMGSPLLYIALGGGTALMAGGGLGWWLFGDYMQTITTFKNDLGDALCTLSKMKQEIDELKEINERLQNKTDEGVKIAQKVKDQIKVMYQVNNDNMILKAAYQDAITKYDEVKNLLLLHIAQGSNKKDIDELLEKHTQEAGPTVYANQAECEADIVEAYKQYAEKQQSKPWFFRKTTYPITNFDQLKEHEATLEWVHKYYPLFAKKFDQ